MVCECLPISFFFVVALSNRMRSVQNRLDELGSGVPIDPQERVQLMWSMITDYCEIYRNTIRGKFDKKLQTYFEHVSLKIIIIYFKLILS